MIDYPEKILLPYVEKKWQELWLASSYPALVTFDNFKAQCTAEILQVLDDHHIYVILLPPNCTDRLQPMEQTCKTICTRSSVRDIQSRYALSFKAKVRNLQLIQVKPSSADWMKTLKESLKSSLMVSRKSKLIWTVGY